MKLTGPYGSMFTIQCQTFKGGAILLIKRLLTSRLSYANMPDRQIYQDFTTLLFLNLGRARTRQGTI